MAHRGSRVGTTGAGEIDQRGHGQYFLPLGKRLRHTAPPRTYLQLSTPAVGGEIGFDLPSMKRTGMLLRPHVPVSGQRLARSLPRAVHPRQGRSDS
jgi:hypothetical protein